MGGEPADKTGMKIWQCYDGLLQQTWTVGKDGSLISLANNQCLDVTKESGPSGGSIYGSQKSMQTWTCSSPDPQQREYAFRKRRGLERPAPHGRVRRR